MAIDAKVCNLYIMEHIIRSGLSVTYQGSINNKSAFNAFTGCCTMLRIWI